MTPETIAAFARKKGIDLVGTGDFTHPAWVAQLERDLEETATGFSVLKGTASPKFVYTVEIACIYSQGGATRRIHLIVLAPTLVAVKSINAQLNLIGNLKADGRPILGTNAAEIVKIARQASPDCLVIPAHVWTPWFSLFGSKSGFNTIEECFGDQTPHIRAIETGLSSDPPMNWRLKQLDDIQIVSFSDAHSAQKMGREATIVELAQATYANLRMALTGPTPENRVGGTIEFFPEEGKYHWDGHRACNVRWKPEETKTHNGICPVCKRPVTVGVLNRVAELADRPESVAAATRPPFFSLIPLDEIIANALGVKSISKKVLAEYEGLVKAFGTEFKVLLDASEQDLRAATQPKIAEGVIRVREKKVDILPGYDGVYGTIDVFGAERTANPNGQAKLL